MIFRIDMQHFISHMIDYFPSNELRSMQYCIISGVVKNGSRSQNVVKFNDLYPTPDTVMLYAETGDKDLLYKSYKQMLEGNVKNKDDYNPFDGLIYKTFINPLLMNNNIVIVCDKNENDYIDCICRYLDEKFEIEVIDLNKLFTEGKIGPIYIDREVIHDKAVDIRRAAIKEEIKNISSTRDGKASLIAKMSTKKKMKELKRYGIKVTKDDKKDLDKMLLDEWCEEDGTE